MIPTENLLVQEQNVPFFRSHEALEFWLGKEMQSWVGPIWLVVVL
jgi:hypothetical protein